MRKKIKTTVKTPEPAEDELSIQQKHKIMLRKLAILHGTSANSVIESLIQKEAANYGLLESRS